MKSILYVKLPTRYPITDKLIGEFRLLNTDLKVEQEPGNILVLSELKYRFEDYKFVELKFPTSIFEDGNFDELYDINGEDVSFEQPGNHSILLKTQPTAYIDAIKNGIAKSLDDWAKKNNVGRVYTESKKYQLNKK